MFTIMYKGNMEQTITHIIDKTYERVSNNQYECDCPSFTFLPLGDTSLAMCELAKHHSYVEAPPRYLAVSGKQEQLSEAQNDRLSGTCD